MSTGLHHRLVFGKLALASRSTLYNRQDSNLDCSEAIMREELCPVCLFLAFRWFLWLCGLAHCAAEKKTAFWGRSSDNRQKMLFQQDIAIIGAVDFYSRINEDQMCPTKR